MTRNQIDWQNMLISGRKQKEDARHNLAAEMEMNRSNVTREYLTSQETAVKRDSLNEAIRHNSVNEWLDKFKNEEVRRHNQISETQNALNNQLQHLDRAEANNVQRSFNNLTAATRELERIDKRRNMEATVSVNEMRAVNDYNVALKQWENESKKVDLAAAQAPHTINKTKAETFATASRGVKDALSSFDQLWSMLKD